MEKKPVILVADNHEDGMYKCRGELLSALTGFADVYISLPKGKYTDNLKALGCRFIDTEFDRRGKNPLSELKLVRFYKKLLSDVKPDVVLTYSIKPNVYLGSICAKRKIPYIVNVTGLGTSIEDGGLTGRAMLFLYKRGIRGAHTVFFQNEKNRDVMLSRGMVRGAYGLIPGSGVNLSVHRFEEYPPDGPLEFLTVGRIMKDKGTDELLAAAREIKKRRPEVVFRLIGFYDGDYREIIENAEKEGVVIFEGHQDDVHSFIKRCHVVVHPSYHEGMANALLESAAAGRPVIATDVPGCRETFEDGVSGIACRAKDAESLTGAIERFIELPYADKAEMGRAGRALMEKSFDRGIVVEKYLEAIKDILNH